MEKIEELIAKYEHIIDINNEAMSFAYSRAFLGENRTALKVIEDLKQLKSSLPKPVEVLPCVDGFLSCGNKAQKLACLVSCKYSILTCDMAEGELKQWLREVSMEDLLSLANGYTVIKEPLYYVRLKNTNPTNSNHCYLWLNQSTKEVFFETKTLKWTNEGNVKNTFTEKEIDEISDGVFVDNKAFELLPVEEEE